MPNHAEITINNTNNVTSNGNHKINKSNKVKSYENNKINNSNSITSHGNHEINKTNNVKSHENNKINQKQ